MTDGKALLQNIMAQRIPEGSIKKKETHKLHSTSSSIKFLMEITELAARREGRKDRKVLCHVETG